MQLSGRGVGVGVGWSIRAAVGVPGGVAKIAAPMVAPLVRLQDKSKIASPPRIKVFLLCIVLPFQGNKKAPTNAGAGCLFGGVTGKL